MRFFFYFFLFFFINNLYAADSFDTHGVQVKIIPNTTYYGNKANLMARMNEGSLYISGIYKDSENNLLAHAICRGTKIMESLVIPLLAMTLVVLGFGAFQGKIKWEIFFSLALGLVIFKSAASILEFMLPGMGLAAGCECRESIEMKIYLSDPDIDSGNPKAYLVDVKTGLNKDCKEI